MVRQGEFFNFAKATSLREGNLWIQTNSNLLKMVLCYILLIEKGRVNTHTVSNKQELLANFCYKNYQIIADE